VVGSHWHPSHLQPAAAAAAAAAAAMEVLPHWLRHQRHLLQYSYTQHGGLHIHPYVCARNPAYYCCKLSIMRHSLVLAAAAAHWHWQTIRITPSPHTTIRLREGFAHRACMATPC
jgi:hypothetical protein